MANAKICDVCRNFYVPNGHICSYGLFKRFVLTNDEVDRCPTCESELNTFIEDLKEKQQC